MSGHAAGMRTTTTVLDQITKDYKKEATQKGAVRNRNKKRKYAFHYHSN